MGHLGSRVTWMACLAALVALVPSCAANGTSCTVMDTASGARISCTDGTSATVADGMDGSNGTAGTDGMDGMDGTDDMNGQSSLIATSAEPAGTNCPAGGVRIDHGVDDDGNGTLDAMEIDGTEYACDGASASSTLVVVTAEPAGANCANAGQRIDTGVDTDASGTLEAGEIDSTSHVCNGRHGSLVDVSDEPRGANCAQGGQRIRVGPDTNGDGVLDDAEVTNTSYICQDASWSLYLSVDGNGNGLYRIDPRTGVATLSGMGISGVTSSTVGLDYDQINDVLYGSPYAGLNRIQVDGSGFTALGGVGTEGLGFDSSTGILYGAINGQFFRVNTMNGANAGALAAPGVDIEGLAVRSSTGTVFGVCSSDDNLRAYNIATNTWSVVGPMGIGGGASHFGYGLAYDHINNVLYATGGGAGTNLYRINPATGAATLVGSTGLTTAHGGLAFARDP